MKLTRLKIAGFKSFVDPVEFLIEPGLTGVVGPNGCGKSNLVEAIRWVMGESSYKSLRASGMARDWFGAAVVEHFAASREWEEREYRRHISDWELARYFEII